MTKILQHIKKCVFCWSDQKLGLILIRSHWMAVVVLALFSFPSVIWRPKGEEARAPAKEPGAARCENASSAG